MVDKPKLAMQSAIMVQQNITLLEHSVLFRRSALINCGERNAGSPGGQGSNGVGNGSGGGLGNGSGDGYGPGYGGGAAAGYIASAAELQRPLL